MAQIIQDELASIRVRIVPAPNFDESDRETLLKELRERLGDSLQIDFELVSTLPTTQGKLQFVVSSVGRRSRDTRQ